MKRIEEMNNLELGMARIFSRSVFQEAQSDGSY